ncbi:CaiB/BaiF CoA-transferase family protein [Phenylobacterium sp. LjRoot225]|uniref:CaiB/BaiF CoA transferase family protein n=1 Tax=Phenylobacterium sp. LjRoot225 TaxID=3342285 RepID=UPI003ED0E72A
MMALKPLSGVRVLDLTALPPGGFCTVVLADLGAEVIRVEPPAQKGKPSLVIGQVALSRGKRSMTLDLRNPASSDVLRRLAAGVDVVVENAKPGAMEARGFGYGHARAENPKIIWCAITGFGQTGPYAEWAGHDLSYLAHSGLLGALTSKLAWQPEISLSLQAGALAAVVGIQAALLQRAQSGEGAFLDISLSEAATWLLTCGINPLSDRPFAIPATPDRRLYACADGRFVAVACAERRTWDALCDGLEAPDLKGALHQPQEAERAAQTLSDIFLTRGALEWVNRLAPAGAAVTIVNHGSQLLEDPHVQARGSTVECAGASVPANPIRLKAPNGDVTETSVSPPARVGDDTEEVLTSVGYSLDQVRDLVAAGLV